MSLSDYKKKLLGQLVAQLAEHFDTVQVVVTSHADGATSRLAHGAGNAYARTSSVGEWLESVQMLGEMVDDDEAEVTDEWMDEFGEGAEEPEFGED